MTDDRSNESLINELLALKERVEVLEGTDSSDFSQREKRLRAIINLAPIGISLLRNNSFEMVNNRFCAMTDYTDEELVGQSVAVIFSSLEDFKKVDSELKRQLLAKGSATCEGQFKSKNGEYLDVLLSSAPIDLGELEEGFIFTAQDISRQKRAERESKELLLQLRQTQKIESIGRLAGGVAHDFNNLLTPILGYADLNLLRLQSNDPMYGDLKAVREAASRARELTLQLLAFGRKQVLEMRNIDLNECLGSIERMLYRVVREDIEMNFRLAPELGPVRADVTQVHQVVLNLVSNAVDALPKGGQLNITTKKTVLDEVWCGIDPDLKPGDYAVIEVSDTGQGMSKETLERIFEPFFTTKKEGEGTGLGLATVYGVVKQHGGHVTVHSKEGLGTTFRVFLPMLAGELPPQEPLMTIATLARDGETILVVEDERIVRDLACAVLHRAGYKVIEAQDPNEALCLVDHSAEPINLLLTDVVMPGLDGKELAEKVMQMSPDTKVIYMSGYTNNVIERHGINEADICLLRKPFSVQELTQKVRETLDS